MGVKVLCYYEYTGHSPRGITQRATDSVMIEVDRKGPYLELKDVLRVFEHAMTTRRREHNVFRPGLRPVEWILLSYLTETGEAAW